MAGRHDRSNAALRALPSVNEVVEAAALSPWREQVPRALIVRAVRAALEEHRGMLRAGGTTREAGRRPTSIESIAQSAASMLETANHPPLTPAINGTGIIIHTGLGRAPLAKEAVEALAAVAGGYAPVELDMPSGERGLRSTIVRPLLTELTGAESATVVNNNAAALVLLLTALAKGRTVVVSRGELIEIGGSFRLPDIMAASGAFLREIGTTNRTRLSDYERAVDGSTALILKIHPSNYRIAGFTQEVETSDLAALARTRSIPLVHDIGSGALTDLTPLGIPGEPWARQSIEHGADLVLFSGDKLLGGPQAGVIVGRQALIDRIERHPLMRAMRVDKLTLAALGATLLLHRDAVYAAQRVPVLAMAAAPLGSLQLRATRLVSSLEDEPGLKSVHAAPSDAYLGGGSLPTRKVPSVALVLTPRNGDEAVLAHRLRTAGPPLSPLLPRIQGGNVWIDLRTVLPRQDDDVIAAVRAACGASA